MLASGIPRGACENRGWLKSPWLITAVDIASYRSGAGTTYPDGKLPISLWRVGDAELVTVVTEAPLELQRDKN